MFKRILLAATFLGAFGAAGLGMSDSAEARRVWRVYPQAYYAPSYSYYRPVRPYRSYYAPRVVVPYGYQYYYGPTGYYSPYYYRPGGVYFSIGF